MKCLLKIRELKSTQCSEKSKQTNKKGKGASVANLIAMS